MRVGFFIQGLPGEGYHGGALTCWTIVKALLRAGHHVTVISLFDVSNSNPYIKSRAQQEAVLRSHGAEVSVVEYDMNSLSGVRESSWMTKVKRFVDRLIDDEVALHHLFPWSRLVDKVQATLSSKHFDASFCYHFDALSAICTLNLSPLMAAVGDLWHLPGYYRWRGNPFSTGKYFKQAVILASECAIAKRLMPRLLQVCHKRGAFAAHYAQWLRIHGVPDALYLRTPVPDVAGEKWAQLRTEARRRLNPGIHRVLVIGDLGTTSTSSGLRAVVKEVLPRLVSEFGENGFELRLVGGGTPPADVSRELKRSYVRFVGRVVPADPEFLSADLMIVPTSIPLGIRVRVITAWSFGCPVIAHSANSYGIPEMQDQENALLVDSNGELGDRVVQALRDPNLRVHLSAGGRRTYEKCFSDSVAGQAIVDEIERLAKG